MRPKNAALVTSMTNLNHGELYLIAEFQIESNPVFQRSGNPQTFVTGGAMKFDGKVRLVPARRVSRETFIMEREAKVSGLESVHIIQRSMNANRPLLFIYNFAPTIHTDYMGMWLQLQRPLEVAKFGNYIFDSLMSEPLTHATSAHFPLIRCQASTPFQ